MQYRVSVISILNEQQPIFSFPHKLFINIWEFFDTCHYDELELHYCYCATLRISLLVGIISLNKTGNVDIKKSTGRPFISNNM